MESRPTRRSAQNETNSVPEADQGQGPAAQRNEAAHQPSSNQPETRQSLGDQPFVGVATSLLVTSTNRSNSTHSTSDIAQTNASRHSNASFNASNAHFIATLRDLPQGLSANRVAHLRRGVTTIASGQVSSGVQLDSLLYALRRFRWRFRCARRKYVSTIILCLQVS